MADPALVDVVLEDPRWAAVDLEPLAERAATVTLRHLGLDPAGFEICVLACDNARIAVLNAQFRQKPTATNVLSWPAQDLAVERPGARPPAPVSGDPDDPESLGDIAIALDTCALEAQQQGKPLADHATHLLVHGVLHLLGYDHIRDKDAALMEKNEVAILATLGVADPYAARAQAPQ